VTTTRVAALLALATCVGLVGCAGKSHAKSTAGSASQAAAVTGPAAVVPGKTVRFSASGFRPGSVELVLAPANKVACCAVRIQPAFTVSSGGTAVLRFAMPTYYKRCTAAGKCKRVSWRPGEKVVVTVSGYLEQAKTTTRIGSRNV